jgi:hypothetical protein
MAEIVNLRLARKAKKRLEDESRAAAKRLAHGRTKSEKQATEIAEQRLRAILDGARRECAEE